MSYCALKYVFSILRIVDKYFDTNITKNVEDNTMFYEGTFFSDLHKYGDCTGGFLIS